MLAQMRIRKRCILVILAFLSLTAAFIHPRFPLSGKSRLLRKEIIHWASDASPALDLEPSSPPPTLTNNHNPDHSANETEITSPQIESLRRKIRESQQLLQTLTNDTHKIQTEINQLEGQYGDQIARISADFDRVKQRASQEKRDVQFRAKSDALKEVFPICDSFYQYNKLYQQLPPESRGRQMVERYEKIFEGVDEILKSFGAKRIFCLGKPFDVETMDAIMTAPSTEYRAGLVCGEYQYGYEMEGRCIRPAMVAVSDGPGPASTTSEDSSNNSISSESQNSSSDQKDA